MAGSGARHLRSAGKNPFFDDEDDVDDETFLRNAPNKPISNSASSTFGRGGNGSQWQEGPATTEEDRRHQLLLERQKIEERTLQATGRSKGILEETEKVGISTAEELIRQREQLERTGGRLDEMNNSLRSSEKHIQNIKSVFSSFKNYFSKPDPVVAVKNGSQEANTTKSGSSAVPGSTSNSSLARMVDQLSLSSSSSGGNQEPHPALRIKGLEQSDQLSKKPLSSVDQQLEQDLGDMSASLSRLKGLAQGLSSELDDQNQLLDRLQASTDKADWRIQRQNKDMERILKK